MKKNRQSGHLLASAALALLAGILGSVLTLFVTGQLTVPTATAPTRSVSEGVIPGVVSPLPTSSKNEALTSASTDTQLSEGAGALGSLPDDGTEPSLGVSSALADAAAERSQLAAVLAQLTQQVDTLEADVINIKAQDVLNQTSFSGAEPQDEMPPDFGNFNDFGESRGSQDRIDSLVASGVDIDRAQALQASQNQYQLARLELFDMAEREGWADSEQFSERLEELDAQRPDLRSELGDDAYDRYLFETGRNNRVVVASIIPGSAADIAGFQAGDVIMTYAGRRVFSTRDLQRATRSGDRGEPIAVTIERQEQTLFYEVPRGPLGVSLSADQESPS